MIQLRGTPFHLPFSMHHFKDQIRKLDKKCKEFAVSSIGAAVYEVIAMLIWVGLCLLFACKIQCGSCQAWSGDSFSSWNCGLIYFCSWDLLFRLPAVLNLLQGAGLCWQISVPLRLYFHGVRARTWGAQSAETARYLGCGARPGCVRNISLYRRVRSSVKLFFTECSCAISYTPRLHCPWGEKTHFSPTAVRERRGQGVPLKEMTPNCLVSKGGSSFSQEQYPHAIAC